MKRILHLLIAAIACVTIFNAQGQSNVYAINIVGYVNRAFGIGESLFANPLSANPNNTLSTLFSPSSTPYGTQISLWNPTSGLFDTTSTLEFDGISAINWSVNFTLNPGTGARLTAPSAFTNTFVGTVLNRAGGFFTDGDQSMVSPLFGGPNDIYLIGDKTPVAASGENIFLNLVGRVPNIGEQVITLTSTSTYLGGGNWDNIPAMAVSDAVFLNIGPVPEPTTLTITMLGFALIPAYRRRRC